jgi:hypothetical protein
MLAKKGEARAASVKRLNGRIARQQTLNRMLAKMPRTGMAIPSMRLFIMNPAREYEPAYVRTGKEHDPTAFDYVILCLSVAATFFVSAVGCYYAQRIAGDLFRRPDRTIPNDDV